MGLYIKNESGCLWIIYDSMDSVLSWQVRIVEIKIVRKAYFRYSQQTLPFNIKKYIRWNNMVIPISLVKCLYIF